MDTDSEKKMLPHSKEPAPLDQTQEMKKELQKQMEAEAYGNLSILEKVVAEMKPDKNLIPLKILSFLFFGGMFAVTPFYTLHMQQLGISVQEIAVIYSVLPLPAIVGPVVSGVIADCTSNFKAVLIANIGLTIVFNMATIYTPVLPVVEQAAAVEFNSSGFAMSNPTCKFLEEVPLGNLHEWSCMSDCFPDDAPTLLNTTRNILCKSSSTQDAVPLDGCTLPIEENPECGYGLLFHPRAADQSDYSLEKANHYYSSEQCSLTCHRLISDSVADAGFSNSKTFWIYFLLRAFSTLFMNASFTMMDASIMAVLLRVGGDYGKQRLVAMLSMATFPFLASLLVGDAEPGDSGVDYSPAFYLLTALLTASSMIALKINLEHKSPEEDEERNMLADLKQLLRKTEVLVFMFIIFLLGANWGYLENYLFVYLNHLGAPTYLLGLTMTFGCLTGVPMLLVSDRIVERLGRQKVYFIGFIAYTVRMFGYSIITNPWQCFIFEALEVFTYQIMWVATVTYYPILAPSSLLGSLSGIAGAVHYNIGRGGGAFIGGFLIAHVGLVWTFRIFGTSCFVFAILYLVLQRFCLEKNRKKLEVDDTYELKQKTEKA